LAELLARLHPLVGGADLLEWEDLVDDRARAAARDQLVRAGEVLGRSHRRAEDRELLPPHAVQLRRRVRARRRAADRYATLVRGEVEGLLPRRLADVLDDNVRAVAARRLLHRL